MSDVTTDTMMHSVAAGIAVDIAEEGFDRVSALLAGIPGGANRAVGSALARAAAAGKTVAKRAVTQEYAISSSEFSNRTKNINNIQRGSNGEVSINFGYRGSVIPLRVFDTKVDRSGAYMARFIAKNIVAAGFAQRCQVTLAYAIGEKEPVMVDVNTFGTGGPCEDDCLSAAVRKAYDLTPAGIIKQLNLLNPIYSRTAAGAHFGREDFPWENIEHMSDLAAYIV